MCLASTVRHQIVCCSQMCSGRLFMVLGSCHMILGQFQMVSGRCEMLLGRCQMVSGKCQMVSGSCQMVSWMFQLVSQRRLLSTVYHLLSTIYWLLYFFTVYVYCLILSTTFSLFLVWRQWVSHLGPGGAMTMACLSGKGHGMYHLNEVLPQQIYVNQNLYTQQKILYLYMHINFNFQTVNRSVSFNIYKYTWFRTVQWQKGWVV